MASVVSVGAVLDGNTASTSPRIAPASALCGADFWQEGRTVERLGIKGLSVRDLRLLAIGEEEKR